TVPNDPDFLAKLVASPNLPSFIYEKLPALYGEPVPDPYIGDDNGFGIIGLPARVNATVQSLNDFMKSPASFTKSDRQRIVSQALLVLSQNYAHLPFKRAMYGIDPIQRLRLLQYQIDQSDEDNLEPDSVFHTTITTIFQSLRDLHTTYRLPFPYSGIIAWLPFFVEEYWETSGYHYIISKVIQVSGVELPDDLLGAELLYWNGTTIVEAIAINADRQAGSNPDARRARGLNSLTLRPLGRGLPPTEETVTIQYLPKGVGDSKELRLAWNVFMPQSGVDGQLVTTVDNLRDSALGFDDHTNDIQEAKKILFSKSEVKEKGRFSTRMFHDRVKNADDALPTLMPTIMRARIVDTEEGQFGHLRIFSFNVSSADSFIVELGTLLRRLPKSGVILDIRGNGGGLILAAEGALRLFTAQPIAPQRAQFINTPLNLKLCERNPNDRQDGARLGYWTSSIRNAVRTGAVYSSGFPITDPVWLNQIEQQYDGPVALITDALCYSSSDIFAAGFQDHA
ncbi:MAG: S41 family peptidase, partial [Candidatus Promineifilaceae bacterium]